MDGWCCWEFSASRWAGVPRARAPPTIVFRELAAESGVVFRFETGTRGRHDLPEIMGGGLALIDGDGDGDLDLFLCAGGPIVPPPSRRNACRYFQNNGRGEWIDASAHANAPGPSYAMGAAVGDFDADGRDDLFVSGWREQRLYRNRGHGRFEDVTERAGVAAHGWSTSAAWADLDGDGDLDLYVCGYLTFDPAVAPYCAVPMVVGTIAVPRIFPPNSIASIATTATARSPTSPTRPGSTTPKDAALG